jgi:hypothetical protein
MRQCVGSLPSARATWAGQADVGAGLAGRRTHGNGGCGGRGWSDG